MHSIGPVFRMWTKSVVENLLESVNGILVPLKAAVHQMVNRFHNKFFGREEAESNIIRSFRQSNRCWSLFRSILMKIIQTQC